MAGPSAPRSPISSLSWSREQYAAAFAAVKDYIAAGDVYQINLTLKFLFDFEGDPVALYAALRRKQRVAYGALIATPELDVLSLSPELFFRREGQHMSTRPMKGTAPRGRTPREDARLKTWLAMDEKQRAENLMIVDLLRNDLGRVAAHRLRRGHRPVHRGDLSLGASDDLGHHRRAALRHGAERHAPRAVPVRLGHRRAQGPRHGDHPRARGRPARRLYRRHRPYRARPATAQFNVAIRTVVLDGKRGEMGIGGGIVADSKEESEYEECLLKAHFLTKVDAPFELIETLRYETGRRLPPAGAASGAAASLGASFRLSVLARGGACRARRRGRAHHRSRSRWCACCWPRTAPSPSPPREITLPTKDTVWRFVISDQRVDEKDPLFYHKTTRRQFYDHEMERQKALTGCDEVVFLNKQGELTEGTRTTLFIEHDGRLFTPALACGLLPGTLREELLDLPRAAASEAVLTPQDLLARRSHLSRQFGARPRPRRADAARAEQGLTRATPAARARPEP